MEQFAILARADPILTIKYYFVVLMSMDLEPPVASTHPLPKISVRATNVPISLLFMIYPSISLVLTLRLETNLKEGR